MVSWCCTEEEAWLGSFGFTFRTKTQPGWKHSIHLVSTAKMDSGRHFFLLGVIALFFFLGYKLWKWLKGDTTQKKVEDKVFDKGESIADWIKEGRDSYQSSNYEEAVNAFSNAIDLDPNSISAYFYRAGAYNKLGNHAQTINNLKAAAKLGNKKAQELLKSKEIELSSEKVPTQGQQQEQKTIHPNIGAFLSHVISEIKIQTNSKAKASDTSKKLRERLEDLKEAMEKDLITKEEYQNKRKEILDEH